MTIQKPNYLTIKNQTIFTTYPNSTLYQHL